MFNKLGQTPMSTGFSWIVILMVIFFGGLIWIILSHVTETYTVPMALNFTDSNPYLNASEKAEQIDELNKWDVFWQFTPFAIIFFAVIFLIVRAVSNREGYR